MKSALCPDVAVVGLGAMGAAVFYQLARRGVDVIGIDQYASPHEWGSSHGETRITRCAVGEGVDYVPFALASHRIWRELEERTGETLLETCGCLVMASSGLAAIHHGKTDFVGRSIASARAAGIAHDEISGEEAMKRFPQLTGAEGARAYFEPSGGYVYPERCIAAQLTLALAAGGKILRRRVSSVSQQSDCVRIEAGGEVVEAQRVVVAAGAWTAALMGAPFDRLLTVSRQVLHWFPVADEAYAPGRFPTLIWMHGETTEDYFYAFPSIGGQGQLKAASEQYGAATTPDTVDREVAPGEAASLYRKSLADRLSQVGRQAVRSAACLYTVTPDSGFIIDQHPAMDRVSVISACSGHGFKHSAGIGEIMARRLCGDVSARFPDAVHLARFARAGA